MAERDWDLERGYYGDRSMEERKAWYDPVAQAYDQARPRYPAEILDRAIALAPLKPGMRLLEIGCGPGIATTALAERGFALVGLEPSRAAWERARHHCADYDQVELLNANFEEWPLEPGAFDAVVAPMQPVYAQYAPELVCCEDRVRQEGQLRELGAAATTGQGNELGLFEEVGFERVDCDRRYTIDGYLTLLSTLSPYLVLEAEKRAALFTALASVLRQTSGDGVQGRVVQTHYFSAAHVLRSL